MTEDDYWKQPEVLKKHAQRRRERYAGDPDVRKAELARQRKIYRDKQGACFRNPAREALAQGLTQGHYTAREISSLLERAPEYIARLITKGLWPDTRVKGMATGVMFSKDQTARLLTVFADHTDNVASTYRRDHEETRQRLFEAVTGTSNEETDA